DDIVRAWKTGDARGLDKLVHEQLKGYPELYQKLLVERNREWVTTLQKLLDNKEDVFVVVGAAHLVGTNSVVEMLKQRGVRVEQVSAPQR
ncbi:MAG: TraB/GumN family protein, partial [Limisphaerales bacterium]